RIWELTYKDDSPEWKKWDAPYFQHQSMSYDDFLGQSESFIGSDKRWVIVVNEGGCGTVSYYFEDAQKEWVDMLMGIFEGEYWGNGLGTRILRPCMEPIFKSVTDGRVGITPWTGKGRMIRVAEKLGMRMEGRIRKVRYYEEIYYDSIRM